MFQINGDGLHIYDYSGKIHHISTDGSLVNSYDFGESSDDSLFNVKGFAMNSDSDYMILTDDDVKTLNNAETTLTVSSQFAHGVEHEVGHFTVDQDNNVYFSETEYGFTETEHSIHVKDSSGNDAAVSEFGNSGSEDNQVEYISDIIIDNNNNVIVSNYNSFGMQHFDAHGNFDHNLGYNDPIISKPFEQIAIQPSDGADSFLVGVTYDNKLFILDHTYQNFHNSIAL